MSANDTLLQRLQLQVQTLMGERGTNPAVRAAPALRQRSKTISDSPTTADFNSLVADIKAIMTILQGGKGA